jgi:actin-like ATPase involved in cell morphogenesis
MGEKGFGEQLFDKLARQRGLSKSRVYKILSLQRLCDEVRALGEAGKLREGVLLEVAKVASPARQKMFADFAAAKALTVDQAKQISKLIRAAEKASPDQANDLWDAFFELKDAIEAKGMTETLTFQLREMAGAARVAPEPAGGGIPEPPEAKDPELQQALGVPRLVPCLPGRGLDVGTTNIVSAGRTPEGPVHHVLQRNAFLDVRNDAFTKKMLIKLGIDHVMHENRMYVIGDPAFELANIFEKETRRPMKDGLISPQEAEALHMAGMVIGQVLGHPAEAGEVVFFSVPAEPIDADRNVIYHRGALESVLRRLGFTPKPMIEGHAVVMSELGEDDFTGIGISCGGGMFNVCVAYKSVPAVAFSTSRGGDWVDINVGKSLGIPASQATAIKEGGVDLAEPKTRQEEAICIYYRELIHYTLATIKRQMETARELPTFSRPVDLVCAGGTALVKGFIQVFEEEYRKIQFPLEVSRIRLARDPLRTVAEGCLAAAQDEMASRGGAPEAPAAPSPRTSVAPSPARAPAPYQGEERRVRTPDLEVLPPVGKLPPSRRPTPPEEETARGSREEIAAPIRKLPPRMPAPAAKPVEETPPVVEAPSGAPAEPAEAAAPESGFGDLTLPPAEEQGSPLPPVEMEPEAPAEEPPPKPKKPSAKPDDAPPDVSIPLIS